MSNKEDELDEYMETVMKQQEAVRKSGHTNMFNTARVKEFASLSGFDELKSFIEESSAEEYIDMAQESSRRFR